MSDRKTALACRRSGLAIIEFALVLPLLVMMMVLIIFFGQAMLSKQNVEMANRQLAWRQAKELTPDESQDNAFLLQYYFASQPIGFVDGSPAGGWNGSRQAEEALLGVVPVGESLNYASDVVNNYYPGNVDYNVAVTLPAEVIPQLPGAWDTGGANDFASYSPEIGHEVNYYRSGIPWQYPNVKIWDPLWNRFVGTFDSNLTRLGVGPDLGLLNTVRQLYELPWKAPADP